MPDDDHLERRLEETGQAAAWLDIQVRRLRVLAVVASVASLIVGVAIGAAVW